MNQNNAPLRVYIMSYNRPEYILESVNSVLTQDYHPLEIVISNNSTNSEVSDILKKINDSRVKVIERKPTLPPIDHFNKLIEEAAMTQFFMLFHDDDKLLPNALNTLMQSFDSNTAAVGSNALVLNEKKETHKKLAPNAEDTTATNAASLAASYFDETSWHAAFPSYIYRTASIRDIRMNTKKGGKHCDVTFLINVVEKGHVKMLADPTIYYRLHNYNDSASFDIRASHSLRRSLYSYKSISQTTLDNYFYKVVLRWAYQKLKKREFKFTKREKVLIRKALSYALQRPSIFTNAIKKRLSSVF